MPFFGGEQPASVALLYRGFLAARTDPTVLGVALHIHDASFGLAKAQELRRQISELDRAGKPVRCYLETAGEGGNGTLEYYLASACSSIALAPAGEINLLGLYADSPFLRGGLDKLRIEPSFLTAGEFKSAGEIFTEVRHSPKAKVALDALLDSFYGQIVDGIASAREQDAATVREWIAAAPLSAAAALEKGLVDELSYTDEFRAGLEKPADGGAGTVELADFLDYARRGSGNLPGGKRVAVLPAQAGAALAMKRHVRAPALPLLVRPAQGLAHLLGRTAQQRIGLLRRLDIPIPLKSQAFYRPGRGGAAAAWAPSTKRNLPRTCRPAHRPGRRFRQPGPVPAPPSQMPH